jgi:hypothetical protein
MMGRIFYVVAACTLMIIGHILTISLWNRARLEKKWIVNDSLTIITTPPIFSVRGTDEMIMNISRVTPRTLSQFQFPLMRTKSSRTLMGRQKTTQLEVNTQKLHQSLFSLTELKNPWIQDLNRRVLQVMNEANRKSKSLIAIRDDSIDYTQTLKQLYLPNGTLMQLPKFTDSMGHELLFRPSISLEEYNVFIDHLHALDKVCHEINVTCLLSYVVLWKSAWVVPPSRYYTMG